MNKGLDKPSVTEGAIIEGPPEMFWEVTPMNDGRTLHSLNVPSRGEEVYVVVADDNSGSYILLVSRGDDEHTERYTFDSLEVAREHGEISAGSKKASNNALKRIFKLIDERQTRKD